LQLAGNQEISRIRINQKKSRASQLNSNDLTIGGEGRHLVRLTSFMVLGLVAVMAANLVESIYIGLLGTVELAALGFTFPLVMLMQSMTMGLAVGASSVVARLVGSNDLSAAKKILAHSLLFTLIFVIIVSLILVPNLEFIFSILGAGTKTSNLAIEYMTFWFVGLPFFAIAMVGSSLMRAVGDAVKPSYLMTSGAGLQVLFGPFFIFGFADFSGFGLPGAAMAFVAARFFSFLLYLYFIRKDGFLVLDGEDFLKSCGEILYVGLPAIAANLIGPLTLSVITRLLAAHGEFVVAGFSLASRIETMLAMVMWGLSMSVAPFVGQNWGARFPERVSRAIRLANLFSLSWGVVAYVVLIAIGPYLVGQVSDDQNVVDAARHYLLIAPLAIGLMGVTMNCVSSFNALGKPSPPLAISLMQMFAFSIPFALLGDYLFGYRGIFVGIIISALFTALIAYSWLRRHLR